MIPTERDRFEGYCDALKESGIGINWRYIYRQDEDIRQKHSRLSGKNQAAFVDAIIRDSVMKYLAADDKPTVICCMNDAAALALIAECKKNKIRVPDDLSVTGFDYIPASAANTPSVTTVRQNFFEMGKSAARSLYNSLVNNAYQSYVIETELVVGNSLRKIN
jgi:DNA-binding LacI/PurR family transcriptional regulator